MPPLVNAAVPDAVDPPAVLRWLAPAVLAAGLAVTAGLAAWSWQREAAEQKTRFDHEADRVVQALTNRVQTYIDTLPGLRALAANGHGLDDAAFARYVDTLSLERRYPGIALTFVADADYYPIEPGEILVFDDLRAGLAMGPELTVRRKAQSTFLTRSALSARELSMLLEGGILSWFHATVAPSAPPSRRSSGSARPS